MTKHKPKQIDAYFTNASKILHEVKSSPVVRMRLSGGIIKDHPTVKPAETFKCISCNALHSVFERNIRGRILAGYLTVKNGLPRIVDGPSNDHPTYHNGRLCEVCFPKYTIQSSVPTDYKSIQLLKDFSKQYHQTPIVTVGQMEKEDALQEIAVEAAKKASRPTIYGIPVEVGPIETAPVSRKDIHVNAFRAFMMSRKGGHKNYDKEVNFSNIKRSVR